MQSTRDGGFWISSQIISLRDLIEGQEASYVLLIRSDGLNDGL